MSKPVNLAERFANSERFKSLFQDGMGLVEESAAYLDGEGRIAAKELPRSSAMLYGSESMRLTTRLMQIASWLLLQRAANEGEMDREQLLEEKKEDQAGIGQCLGGQSCLENAATILSGVGGAFNRFAKAGHEP